MWITVPVRASSADRASSRGRPLAVAVPPSRTTQCEAERASPSAAWLSTTTAVPAPVSVPMRSRTRMTPAASREASGSSSTSTAGAWMTAQAMARRRSSPPERVAGSRSRKADRPVSSATPATCRSISGRAAPRFSRPKASSSATVERTVVSMAAASCGTKPTPFDQAEGSIRGSSWPPLNSSTLPAWASEPVSVPECPGRSQPASNFPRVVFPLPDPPRTAVSVPGRTLKAMSRSAAAVSP